METFNEPLISVVMPMYNSGEYVREALTSLQNQTINNYEVIIVDNCSTDNSVEIVEQLHDKRFHVYINEKNRGLLYSLQRGVNLAKGKYIARLDSDDISYPNRFKKQVDYLESHPEVLLCGCEKDLIINGHRVVAQRYPIYGRNAIKYSLLYGDFRIAHSSFMFRRKELEDKQISYEKFQHCQDYHLLLTIARNGEVAMLSDVLISYRKHPEQLSITDDNQFVRREEDEIRSIYADNIHLEEEHKNILFKSLDKELKGTKDIDSFQKLMDRHSELIGVDIHQKNTREFLCAQFIFWYTCTCQKTRDISLLVGYIKSEYKNWKWLLGTKAGFLWGICCLLGYNTRG